ncbi:MAG TPA: hypothetical protein VFR86_26790 [Burkholderiaceae bacterium]|nr:hypothetical protein [Burkholderiaceae bacterium]
MNRFERTFRVIRDCVSALAASPQRYFGFAALFAGAVFFFVRPGRVLPWLPL